MNTEIEINYLNKQRSDHDQSKLAFQFDIRQVLTYISLIIRFMKVH